MNFDRIIDIIENNALVDAKALTEVEQFHEKFPFTSIFPSILLKGLKNSKNVHFESKLKELSIQINDRGVLERYLEKTDSLSIQESIPTDEKETIEKTVEPPIEIIETEKLDTIEDNKEEEIIDQVSESTQEIKPESKIEEEVETTEIKKEAIPVDHHQKKKSAGSSLELDPETKRIIEELQKKYGDDPKVESSETKEPETEQISNTPSSEDENKELSEEKEVSLEKETTDRAETDESDHEKLAEVENDKEEVILKPKEKSKSKKKKKKKSKKDKKKIKDKLSDQNTVSPFKFKEFKGEDEEYYHLEIDFSDLEPIYDEEDEETEVEMGNFDFEKHPEIDEIVDDFIEEKEEIESSFQSPVSIKVNEKSELTFMDWLKANKETSNKQVDIKKSKTNTKKEAIIDKFIEEDPSISQSKKEFFSPTKNAKKSLEDDLEIVSETLAELHVYQHNYSKAKKIYKKLILKFPEKKSLFAQKLEEISSLQKKK